MLGALDHTDRPLLNGARAAVLDRLSAECLYEYFDLDHVARALRTLVATNPEAKR